MTVPIRRVVALGATLLGVVAVIALVRTQSSVAPSAPVTTEVTSAISEPEARIETGDGEHLAGPLASAGQSESVATGAPIAAPEVLPQNVEDLRAAYPLLVARLEPNEQRLGAEGKDPLWSGGMEARIVDEISRKALGLEITDLQVDCRTTLCRVDMTFPLQFATKTFEPFTPDTAWNGKQPLMFFVKALDLDFREQVAAGLNRYGTPVLVGYVFRPPEKTNE
jgi:hypothetical protein